MKARHAWRWLALTLIMILVILSLVVFNPALQRKFYYDRIVRAVPLGSTKAQFDQAVMTEDRLADDVTVEMDGKTVIYVMRHPIKTGLVEMFVCAEPELGADGKIAGYQIWSGYHFPIYNENTAFFVYPQPY